MHPFSYMSFSASIEAWTSRK